MEQMTSRERFARMYAHREADRVPIIDTPWPATIERWRREGMPGDVSFVDYFGLDHVARISVDNSPRYEVKTLEETDEYVVGTTPWGVTVRNWKHAASTPEFLAHTVTDRSSWAEAKERMSPTRDRVPWDHLQENYPKWREEGHWIVAGLWFGFDVTHSWTVGTERLLFALADDPDWCVDMFNTFLDVNIALLDMVWEAGYGFDCVSWPDDMGYKQNQFFSVGMYRDLLKPVHRRAIEWAHSRGAKAHLHSCGDVRPFVPELVGIGLDALNPLEVKAGMDPLQLKEQYGDVLVLHGGINAVLWDKPEAISEEIRRVVPDLKKDGGYIFSSDHSVPSSVSLEDFRHIVELAKRAGSYR
ncbi:MAG: uroporphyrinogen decarboxylase family protein [Candidatus Brocadiaceae bacterium]|jgi:uroporphyrinogen decarboxylase